MSRRLAVLLLAATSLTWLSPAIGRAQSVSAQARDHVRAGLAYAERGKWEDALREFEEAHSLEPHPLRLFDVAQARLKTGRFRAAAEAFALLSESPMLDDEQKARARVGLATAKEKIARLKISTSPSRVDESVTIDDAPASLASVNEVDPGTHVVRLRHDGKVAAEETVELGEGGYADVVLTPKPSPVVAAPSSSTRKDTPVLGWVAGGVALAALGTGIYFSASGYSGYGDLEASGCVARRSCAEDDVDAVRAKVIAGDVLIGVSLIAGAIATWIFLRSPSPTPRAALAF